MSLERRKPFALLHPNAKPTDSIVIAPNSAPPQLPISRPRRQMPAAYHHQPHQLHNPHKRYATVLPGSSRSSATSSAESIHSTGSLMLPRRRKVSAAEDMAARVRARWAALEALERTGGAPTPIANPADAFAATNTNTATATTNTTTIRGEARSRIDPQAAAATDWRPQRQWDRRGSVSLMEMGKDREKENEISMSTSMQVDGQEKPLPPRPAPLALALHKFPEQAPLSAPARMPTAPSMAMAMTTGPMMVDAREGEKDGATPGAGAREGEILPASESTLRTTPTSLTCFETTESQRQVLQRRPTRALTPPQVRRRPSITDELEEAVSTVSIPDFHTHMLIKWIVCNWQREEATLAMLHTSRTDGLLRCPRRGCDSLLGGVRALTFHLHIHAVGAGAYACVRCGGAFESARELTRHACARRRARGASLFLVPRFHSVLRARLTIKLLFLFLLFPYFFFLQL